MDAKDQHHVLPARASKLRYPLRSAAKSRDEKPATADASGRSSASRRKTLSSVSKGTSVLDSSGKDKTGRTPRRLSVPPKMPTASPGPATVKCFSPTSELSITKPDGQGKAGSPTSEVSKALARKKFNALASASYWLSQIKLSELTSSHSISLGFFKLALESGCEPLQRLREELKSYACRHNIIELGEPARELLRGYDILEALEQLQISQAHSPVAEELINTSNEQVTSRSISANSGNLKPNSPNGEARRASEPATRQSSQKEPPSAKNRASRSHVAQRTVKDGNDNAQRKLQKATKSGSNKEKEKVKTTKQLESASEIAQPLTKETPHEDKENMDRKPVEVVSLTEESQTS